MSNDQIPKLASGEPVYKYARVHMETPVQPVTSFGESKQQQQVAEEAYTLGPKVYNSPTCSIYEVDSVTPGKCLIVAKKSNNGNEDEKLAALMCSSACLQLFNYVKFPTSLIKKNVTSLMAWKCDVIPIKFVVTRVATSNFVEQHPKHSFGETFYPPKINCLKKTTDDGGYIRFVYEVSTKGDNNGKDDFFSFSLFQALESLSIKAFEILEKLWINENMEVNEAEFKFAHRLDNKEIVLSGVPHINVSDRKKTKNEKGSLIAECAVGESRLIEMLSKLKSDQRPPPEVHVIVKDDGERAEVEELVRRKVADFEIKLVVHEMKHDDDTTASLLSRLDRDHHHVCLVTPARDKALSNTVRRLNSTLPHVACGTGEDVDDVLRIVASWHLGTRCRLLALQARRHADFYRDSDNKDHPLVRLNFAA